MVLQYWEEIEGYTESKCLLAIPGSYYFQNEDEAFFFSMFDEEDLFLDLDLSGILVRTPYQHWESEVEQSATTQPTIWNRISTQVIEIILKLRFVNARKVDIPCPESEENPIHPLPSLPTHEILSTTYIDEDDDEIAEVDRTQAKEVVFELFLSKFLKWADLLQEEHCGYFEIKGHWVFLYLSENPLPICENPDIGYYLCTNLREAPVVEVKNFLYWYMSNDRLMWEYEPEPPSVEEMVQEL